MNDLDSSKAALLQSMFSWGQDGRSKRVLHISIVLHLNFELCVAEESSVFWGKDS